MNFNLNYLPERSQKDRLNGITIITDSGLSNENLINTVLPYSKHVDFIKFHASLYKEPNINEKISTLIKSGIQPFFSGTLFEIFYVRGMTDSYVGYLKDLGLNHIELSDSLIDISPSEKLQLISKLAKEFRVISEVGSKLNGVILTSNKWKEQIINELAAGAWKVVIEGGVNGDSGMYNANYEPRPGLIQSLLTLGQDKLIWETAHTVQQAWFINKFGANVNLGNINSNDILNVENMRLGLHPYTFFSFLPESIRLAFDKKISPMVNIDFQI